MKEYIYQMAKLVSFIVTCTFISLLSGTSLADTLTIDLPKNPICNGKFNVGDKIGARADRKGCTRLFRAAWRDKYHPQDVKKLELVEQKSIKWLTYHHQAFRSEYFKKLTCHPLLKKNKCLQPSRIRKILDERQLNKGIRASYTGMHSHHFKQGWGDLAYHYIIDLNGNIAEGRPLKFAPHSGTSGDGSKKDTNGNHYYPNHLAVVLAGNYDYQQVSKKTRRALARILAQAMLRFKLDEGAIKPHKHHSSNTTCPGSNIGDLEHSRIVQTTLAMSVQTELVARGCKPGQVDGDFGPTSISALKRLNAGTTKFGNGLDLNHTLKELFKSDVSCIQ